MLVFHTTDQNKIQQVLNGCADDFKEYGMSSKGKPLTFSGGASVFHGEDMLVKLFNYADDPSTPAMSTCTPTVYNGRAYVGVSGTSQFGAYSGI